MTASEEHSEVLERLDSLEDEFKRYNGQLSTIGKDVGIVKECLVGDLEKDKPGLAERVRAIEKWIESRKKFEWLLVTIVVAQFIGFVFFLIRSVILP